MHTAKAYSAASATSPIIVLVSNNRKVMDDKVNGTGTNIVGWIAAVVMFAAAIGMLLTWGK